MNKPVEVYHDPEVENYMNYLEKCEARMRAMEEVLNKIQASSMLNRDNFLREFKNIPEV